MMRTVTAAGSTLTAGELREALLGVDDRAPIVLPGFGQHRPIRAVDATDLEVMLHPDPTVLEPDLATAFPVQAEP